MDEPNAADVVVIGSVAYDVIGTTAADITRPETRFNVKLTSLHEDFGGCGGNVAYNLAGLGVSHLLVCAAGGDDFDRYRAHLERSGVTSRVDVAPGERTARALIVTDRAERQLTAFYPGPPLRSTTLAPTLASVGARLVLVTPLPADEMGAALEASAAHRPDARRVWCPGQYAGSLTSAEARALTRLADWIVGNETEIAALGGAIELAARTVVTTRGPGPVTVTATGRETTFAVPAAPRAADPTGCGDAFLAGLVSRTASARARIPWQAAVEAGTALAQRCLAARGSQRHAVAG